MKRKFAKTLYCTAALSLSMATLASAQVVINEVMYDQDGGDAGEYVELYNAGGGLVDISGYVVELVNGSNGTSYNTITVPAATNLAAGGYYVIGNAATIDPAWGGGTVDQDVNLNNGIQNGAPDAVVLYDSGAVRLDSFNYEGDGSFGVGALTADATAEGGFGRVVSRVITNTTNNVAAGRLPNGVDTDSNLADFASILASPGAANADSITLPFSDSFTGAPDLAWLWGFVATRSVDGLTTLGVASTDGGDVLEVVDTTGGGDTAFLPASLGLVNVEGEIWIPADSPDPWSQGIGVADRNNPNWFSGFTGNGMENGYYLEYQNGTVSGLKGISGVSTPVARLIAVSSEPTINAGSIAGATALVLGNTADVNKGAWNSFQVFFDQGGDRLYASINGSLIYDGSVPTDEVHSTDGGIVVGFREAHAGTPVAGEGAYVDGLVLNTTAPAATTASSVVTVNADDASPNNITTFNSLQQAINSFQIAGVASVNGGVTTDGAGVGVNSATPDPHVINIITTSAIDEVVRIDERVGALGYAVLGSALTVNGPGAVAAGAPVAPSAASNALVLLQDETGIVDDDGLELRTDVDVTFNNVTFAPSPTAAPGDDMVTIDRVTAANLGAANTIAFTGCVFTSLDAGNLPVVSDKLGALVDNVANIATPTAAMDKLIAFFPDAGESMHLAITDCVISHSADNDGYLDLVPFYAAGDGSTTTITSSVISYNGIASSRYGIQASGSNDLSVFTITGSNVGDGPIAGLGGPTVILGNPRGLQSFYGSGNGQLNIDNTIVANNTVRQISTDAEIDLTLANSLVYGPVPLVLTNGPGTVLPTTITESTIVRVGGSALLGDDLGVTQPINITDSVLASSDGSVPLGAFSAGDIQVNLDFTGYGAFGISAGLANVTPTGNVFQADPVFVSTDPTSADFLDVQNTDYATANSVAGPLAGGADYVGGVAPAAVALVSGPVDLGMVDTGLTADDTTTVSFTNTGGANGYVNLAISGVDAAEFSSTPTGDTLVAAGGIPVTVTFAPVTTGVKSASLDVTGDAAGSVSLAGEGVTPSAVGDWMVLEDM